MSIDDVWSHEAMRRLGRPLERDPAILAGASGSAALGGLMALCRDTSLRDARQALSLGPASTVITIVSEGVTDPELWQTTIAAS